MVECQHQIRVLAPITFDREPDFSVVAISLKTDAGIEGNGVVFNLGAGNDWIA